MREQTEQERGTAPGWLPYFTEGERRRCRARQTKQMGGHRLLPTTETATGRLAVLADPKGAAFAVFEGETDP
jgi:predicted enzyme related to lactoylglutathione lyase